MPKYNKKITRLMDYEEFKEGISDLSPQRQAFISVLFFAGVRVSEALVLESTDINCTKDIIYVQFFRLKGSTQTDPVGLPRTQALNWMCDQTGRLFPFSRSTGYRIVRKAFPELEHNLYPHFFRQNRIVKISEEFGDPTVYSFTGICAQSIDHYRGKVDIKKVSRSLWKEVRE